MGLRLNISELTYVLYVFLLMEMEILSTSNNFCQMTTMIAAY